MFWTERFTPVRAKTSARALSDRSVEGARRTSTRVGCLSGTPNAPVTGPSPPVPARETEAVNAHAAAAASESRFEFKTNPLQFQKPVPHHGLFAVYSRFGGTQALFRREIPNSGGSSTGLRIRSGRG